MGRTTERRSDSRHVIDECLLNIDEVDRSLAPHVAIPDQIAEQPCMIRRNRRTVTESIEAPRLRHPVSLAEFPGLTPAVFCQHLVIGCRPNGCATGDPQPDHILRSLVEPGHHGPRMQRSVLGRGHDMDLLPSIDNILNAMRCTGDRIEDPSALCEALVLDDLDPGPVADRVGAVLEGFNPPDVQANRGVELQSLSARCRFGSSEHHPDFFAELVDEDRGGARIVQCASHFSQRLAHQPGLQADVAVPHLAFDLGPRHQRGDRVDDQDVQRAGADQHVGDLQRLLTGVGLGYQQRVGVHPSFLA